MKYARVRRAIVSAFREVKSPISLIELWEALNLSVAIMILGEDFPLMDGSESYLPFSIGNVRVELMEMINDGIVEVHKDYIPSREDDDFVMENAYSLK